VRPEEYMALDATALAGLVRSGEVSATDAVEAAIERINALNPQINAVVERADAMGRSAALSVNHRQPLAGVPFLAKDMNIEVAGLRLTSACRWLADIPPASVDAPLAARWRAAGLCILGRTNTPEFAGEFVTEPTWRGATANPWDLTRSPGGSSGGAAAAVASGMVPLAHANDSGGSIRVPASACGLVGLKPSRGWIPVGPQHDELAGGFNCEHVVTRSVRDCALMLDVTRGAEPGSRYPAVQPARGFASLLDDALPQLRIGIALRTPGGHLPADEVGAAVEDAAALLARAGHHISEFHYPESAAHVDSHSALIWMAATAEEIDHYRRRLGNSPQPDELEALSWACVEVAIKSSAVDYVRARRALTGATRAMALAFDCIDLMLLPTTSTCAIPTGSIDGRTGNFSLAQWNEDSYRYAPYTGLFNVTGQPAISLPLAESSTGLPIGVQFAAPLGEDGRLLMLAGWLERERPWAGRLAALRQRFRA
jgi:amidase